MEPKKRKIVRQAREKVDERLTIRPEDTRGSEITPEEATHNEVVRIQNILNKINGPMNYFEFVVNPSDFSQTIENIFHLAFLVKDGKASIQVENDLPILRKAVPYTADNGEEDTIRKKQVLVSLDRPQWRAIIKLFNIKHSFIPPRAKIHGRIIHKIKKTNNFVLLFHSPTEYLANRLSGFFIALNSKLFPNGSIKNIVICSPGSPTNRAWGSIIKSTLFLFQSS